MKAPSPHQTISTPDINFMPTSLLLDQVLLPVTNVMCCFLTTLEHCRDKTWRKSTTSGMERLVVTFMEGIMMWDILLRSMLQSMESVLQNKSHNRKVFFMTGIKSSKHTSKHNPTFVLQTTEQLSVTTSKPRSLRHKITSKAQTVGVEQCENTQKCQLYTGELSTNETPLQMSIQDQIMLHCGHSTPSFDRFIFLISLISS